MKIGIIGAGKMGYTIGKHFVVNNLPNIHLIGYYSKNLNSAIDAAKFTNSKYYDSLQKLIELSDILFLTVPDGEIKNVMNLIKKLEIDIAGKIICHTSGALSSAEMKAILPAAYMYSIHPIIAVNSKTESYISFADAFITIEGDAEYIEDIKDMFCSLGHSVKLISSYDKVKYHSAAVFSSNLVIGLYRMAEELLLQCGFDNDEVNLALKPLFINNANKLKQSDCYEALTGPIERCDVETIKKHFAVLADDYYDVYKLLSKKLVNIAEIKNKDKDYSELYNIFNIK